MALQSLASVLIVTLQYLRAAPEEIDAQFSTSLVAQSNSSVASVRINNGISYQTRNTWHCHHHIIVIVYFEFAPASTRISDILLVIPCPLIVKQVLAGRYQVLSVIGTQPASMTGTFNWPTSPDPYLRDPFVNDWYDMVSDLDVQIRGWHRPSVYFTTVFSCHPTISTRLPIP